MFKATTDKLIMLKKIGFRMFNLHGNIYMVSVSAVRPDMTIFSKTSDICFYPGNTGLKKFKNQKRSFAAENDNT